MQNVKHECINSFYTKGTFAAYRSIDVKETFKIFVKYSGFFHKRSVPYILTDLEVGLMLYHFSPRYLARKEYVQNVYSVQCQ
jgi:hypothetical protein